MVSPLPSHQPRLWAYPTDTVWGLGHLYSELELNNKLAAVKKIRNERPYSILFSHIDELCKQIDPKYQNDVLALTKLFSMESTFCLPQEIFIGSFSLPFWPKEKGAFIGVRVLSFSWVKEIIKYEGGPIVSTSLNHTGHPSILNFNEAKQFIDNENETITMPENKEIQTFPCSGRASTIFSLNFDKRIFSLIREGMQKEKIENELINLFDAK